MMRTPEKYVPLEIQFPVFLKILLARTLRGFTSERFLNILRFYLFFYRKRTQHIFLRHVFLMFLYCIINFPLFSKPIGSESRKVFCHTLLLCRLPRKSFRRKGLSHEQAHHNVIALSSLSKFE